MTLGAGLRRSIVGALLLALIACLAPRAVRASWRSNVTPGSDIIMKDHRWPEWTGGTYYSIWSNGFKGGRFYGGHASTTKGGTRKPGIFWTHWGRIEYVASGPELYSGGPGGAEGSSGGYGGKPNLKRTREAMAVRSIAVHPKDPKLVLRGGGVFAGGRPRSGLWKSVDGGSSWKLVTDGIDFDGTGPTALFGEVIVFSTMSEKHRDVVVAGGESTGLFVSTDTGDTWKPMKVRGMEPGERITALAFWDWLVAGTFADSEFEALGLGKPHTKGKDHGSIYGIYVHPNGNANPRNIHHLPDFGVTAVVLGIYSQYMSDIASTRGVYHGWNQHAVYIQKRANMESDTLYVALGGKIYKKEIKKGFFRAKADAYAAPFSAPPGNQLYRSPERLMVQFKPLPKGGSRLVGARADACVSAGVTCITPDHGNADTLFFCNIHGIFKSTDGGRTFRLVLESEVE